MFKQAFLLISLIFSCMALDIDVKVAKEGADNKYSILNLSSPEPFECSQDYDYDKPLNSYSCTFKNEPKSTVKPLETQFFNISSSVQNGLFKLSIRPKGGSKIFSYDFNPTGNDVKQMVFTSPSKKFAIVAFEKKLPFLTPRTSRGLNFPVSIESEGSMPYVKTLDINGIPLNENPALNDMKEYADIKKMVERKDFKNAITAIDRIEKIFPNSIFYSEYELYRIKSMMGAEGGADFGEVIKRAKMWLKEYPTDEKTAEVLLVMANAYARSQDFNNATYYFDRVINDYDAQEISKLAMIDFADALRASKPKYSAELYKKALYKTKDLKTASNAAFKLTDTYLLLNDPTNAAIHAEKLLTGNPDYLLKDKGKSFELAKRLANQKAFQVAYEITNLLIKNSTNKDENYEVMLGSIGLWGYEAGDIVGAKGFFARYIREYPASKHAGLLQEKLDRLNFENIDAKDADARIAEYDAIIKRYPKDEISKKALAKKIQALSDLGRCDDVLGYRAEISVLGGELPNSAAMIGKCEKQKTLTLLKRGDCKEALSSIEANGVRLESVHDGALFDCLIKTQDYGRAKNTALGHTKTQDINEKLLWMNRAVKATQRLNEHKTTVSLSRDILTLSQIAKQPKYDMVAFDMFASANALGDTNAMIEAVKIIESRYPASAEALSVYKDMLRYGLAKTDVLTAQNYAKKMYELQNRLKVFNDTPWLEFTYSDMLSKNGDTMGALTVLSNLKDKKLAANDKARQLYNAATLWQKAGKKEQSKKLLVECAGGKEESSWKKLCQDGLELYK
jgi:outer membrane protein assembly factor BamD (BamD/ComL family)